MHQCRNCYLCPEVTASVELARRLKGAGIALRRQLPRIQVDHLTSDGPFLLTLLEPLSETLLGNILSNAV